MAYSIISRKTWGARAFLRDPRTVPPSERDTFMLHYDGPSPIYRTGYAIPQAIDRYHQSKDWIGIGYNFVIDQAGNIYEGRGWDVVGAHCVGYNRRGIGVQIAIGGDQEPTSAALAAAAWLYGKALAHTGKKALTILGHRDGMSTSCPGGRLYAIVQAWRAAGRPDTGNDPADPTPVPGRQTLRYGARGPAVEELQQLLISKGHDTGGGKRLAADAVYGPITVAAVREFQTAQKIDVDGIAGPVTFGKLYTATGMPKLRPGYRGEPVELLQQLLNKAGADPALSDDGVYGAKTGEAIRAFQKARRLDVDGIVGPATWAALLK